MKHQRPTGFTLIEVMITVAIVAILAAVAYPSYRDSVLKGKRAEARTALTELLQQQERFITQRNSYFCFNTAANTGVATAITADANGLCAGTTSAATVPFKAFTGSSAATSSYVLLSENCRNADDTKIPIQDCVRLVAIPRGTHDSDYDKAGALRITSTGVKDCLKRNGTVVSGPSLCWP